MASSANNAALKAAINAGGYNNFQNLYSNYVIPSNQSKYVENRRNQMRLANESYASKKEENKTVANLQYRRNIVKELVLMGVLSARPTKKQRENAARERKAIGVMQKIYLKKAKTTGAKKAGKRIAGERLKKYKANMELKKKMNEFGARARARGEQLAAARRETVTLGAGAIGPRGTLTAAGKAVAPSNKPKPTTTTNRAQVPMAVAPQRANRGAPGAFATLSPDAVAAAQRVVAREVTKPSGAQSRILKALKKR